MLVCGASLSLKVRPSLLAPTRPIALIWRITVDGERTAAHAPSTARRGVAVPRLVQPPHRTLTRRLRRGSRRACGLRRARARAVTRWPDHRRRRDYAGLFWLGNIEPRRPIKCAERRVRSARERASMGAIRRRGSALSLVTGRAQLTTCVWDAVTFLAVGRLPADQLFRGAPGSRLMSVTTIEPRHDDRQYSSRLCRRGGGRNHGRRYRCGSLVLRGRRGPHPSRPARGERDSWPRCATNGFCLVGRDRPEAHRRHANSD